MCNYISLGCDLGVYGSNCDMSCPINCKDQMCDIVNGTCFGCEPGWTGDTCKQGNALFENVFFINKKIIKKNIPYRKKMKCIRFLFV